MKTTKLTYYISLLFIALMTMNFQCNDCDEELHDQSNFDVVVNLTESVMSIGDTINLKTELDSQIELKHSESIYDNSNQAINYRIKIFEATSGNTNASPARDDFDFVDVKGNVSLLFRPWEINIDNTCDDQLCELEFGMIPQRTGYFGILLQLGNFGLGDCQFLTLFPNEIQSNGTNNFGVFEEINISRIRVDGANFKNPETEKRLFFFKVIE